MSHSHVLAVPMSPASFVAASVIVLIFWLGVVAATLIHTIAAGLVP
jgi:hypothetical protein